MIFIGKENMIDINKEPCASFLRSVHYVCTDFFKENPNQVTTFERLYVIDDSEAIQFTELVRNNYPNYRFALKKSIDDKYYILWIDRRQ